jgi:ribosome-associated protein
MCPPVEPFDESDDLADRPSRSARKRAAEHMQKLGVRLVAMRESQLDALDLPEELRTALREARRLRGQSALARQHQYIGRLMRALDAAPIEAALDTAAALRSHRGKMPR